uniref:Uncharacterized protein n=1 Tax=Stegastes partitus TaxID=144197 RepID=A0A3B5BB64_9TELE
CLCSVMKQESRLTNLQRKEANKHPKSEFKRGWRKQHGFCVTVDHASLPLTSDPPLSSPPNKSKRSAESCRSGNSYEREKFCPGPTRDLEKEKRRLQNILATGKEEASAASSQKAATCRDPEVSEEEDRYQEVLNEIEERRQFLADMASLGQEMNYISIINTEISQKIRELEALEKAHSSK